MALPSSPPLLPFADPATSPPLLLEEATDLPVRPTNFLVSRRGLKRQLSDYASNSSDPLFSEGTSEAEEEDGDERRQRKRLVRGPYFNFRRSSTRSLRRSMAKRDRIKNADSGVWLGSDMTDDSSESAMSSQERMESLEVGDRIDSTCAQKEPQQQPLSPAQAAAVRTIHQCLEVGRESIDLTGLNLNILSNDILKSLHQLIRPSHTNLTEPPSEDEFTSLTPSIQLFLSGNKLTTLPSELFRLTNIVVLSLRNNNLSEIPPGIGILPHLQELNIAQNNIKWLPWEMLDLFHCQGSHRQITVRPNPLIDAIDDLSGPSPLAKPQVTKSEYNEHLSRWGEMNGAFFNKMKQWYSEDDVPWTMRHELELRLKLGRLKRTMYLQEASRAGTELKLCREQLVYLASSMVQFFDVDGSACRSAAGNVSNDDGMAAVVEPLPTQSTPTNSSTTASLFEIALRTIQSTCNLQDIPEDLPVSLASALQQAARGAEYGNEKCSICGKHFIIARAQWIEFWFNGFPSQECLTRETILPFFRKVCSWRCAQPNELGAFRF